jgi:cytochrome c1
MRRLIAVLLAFSIAMPLPAQAVMLATDNALGTAQHQRVDQLLERADVQARLQAYGVSPADVKARVAALTDQEAADLAARIDSLPAGGEGIIGAIVLIFLVLLLTDILGFTHIFPFTKPIK